MLHWKTFGTCFRAVQTMIRYLLQVIHELCMLLTRLLRGAPQPPPPNGLPHRDDGATTVDLRGRLEEELRAFAQDARAYYIFVEANEQQLERGKRDDLEHRYGRQFARPSLDLGRVFIDIDDYSHQESLLQAALRTRGDDSYASKRDDLEERLKDLLLEQAKKEARTIVRELVQTGLEGDEG